VLASKVPNLVPVLFLFGADGTQSSTPDADGIINIEPCQSFLNKFSALTTTRLRYPRAASMWRP